MNTCPRCRRQYADGVRFCPSDGSQIAQVVDPYLGKTLKGQLQLVAIAGRGAMGTVYRAEQARMDRTVAVKVLRSDLLKDDMAVKRFLREAQAAARLSHPNIVTVHDVGESDEGVPFIVMEYVEGTTLAAQLERERVLPPARAIRVARQIASALAEAHGHGIVHRDLKSENILLVTRRAEPDVVKVLDFGIAKLLSGDGGEIETLTRDGTIFGTPHYIAPEQAVGQDVDGRADLYSLGVILFRAVTGRLPFDGTSGMQVLMRHVREEPPRPRAIRPDVPEPIQAIILRALEKERERRFADAEAFIAALDAAAAALTDGHAVETHAAHEILDASRTLMGVPLAPRPGDEPHPPLSPQPRATPTGARKVARRSDDASATRAGDVGLDAWSRGGDDVAARAVATDPDYAIDTGPHRRSIARRRHVGVVVVAAGGASLLGVLAWAALRPREPEPRTAHASVDAGEARPAAPRLALVDEQVVSTADYTLRLGFERSPVAGDESVLHVSLEDARGARRTTDRLDVDVRGAGEREDRVPLRVDAGNAGYVASVLFRQPGRHRVRLAFDGAAARREAAAFDVDVAPTAHDVVDARRGRPEPTQGRVPHAHRASAEATDDDPANLPVTVIPADSTAPARAPFSPRALGPAPGGSAREPGAPAIVPAVQAIGGGIDRPLRASPVVDDDAPAKP